MAMAPDIKPRMSLDPTGVDDDNRFVDVAQYYEQLGFIRRVADGYGVVSITARGIQYVEGDLQQQQSSGSVTFNVQNAYGSIFGTQQHAEMSNVSFDFNTVEAELDEVEEVKGEAEEIYERYRARLEDLAAEMDEELEPLDERLETLQQAIREKLAALDPDLPGLPEPEVTPEDEGWLFDSRRDYLEQLQHYKER